MVILARNRDSGGGDNGLTKHTIGNALVVYPVGNMTKTAQDLALTVTADTENDLVVVDLPASSPISMWESVAQVLPKRRRGVRLVIGGRSRETAALAGHWLAERLKRTVLVPDGQVVRGAGGSLLVHSGHGNSGWVRCTPGKPPKFDSKRFPKPSWESGIVQENFPTSARGLAEQLPSGIWIRPIGDNPQLRRQRQRLVETMPLQPEHITVVLGSPGGVPLGVDDVALMWRVLPENVRARVRFVQFGPMSVPRGELGQVLADALGREIVFYSGMPVGPAAAPEIFTVRDDGSLGWHAHAREMSYQPRLSDEEAPKVPSVVSHRAPVPGSQEISPGVYWYSVDAVVEVIQSGLLVRPLMATKSVDAIRSLPADPVTHNVMYDAEDDAELDRMRFLAEDLVHRLSNSVRTMSRVLSGRGVLREHAKPDFSPASAGLFPGTTISGGIFQSGEQAPVASLYAPTERTVVIQAVGAPTVQAAAEPVAPDWTQPGRVGAEPATVQVAAGPEIAVPSAPPSADVLMSPPAPPSGPMAPPIMPSASVAAPVPHSAPMAPPVVSSAATAPPVAPSAPVAPPVLESSPAAFDAPVRPPGLGGGLEVPPIGTPAAESETPAPEPVAVPVPAPAIARLQPVPSPEATGLLPKRGIEDERAWLRRNLAGEFGVMSNSVARILSEHPGLQGALSNGSSEVITDAVAVQLYLTTRGKAVDDALRTGAVGPHVPFARCVVAGLSRLPSHRGPAVFTASLTPGQWDLYRNHKLFTEWGFLHALTAPAVESAGDVDVLVWSMTARRTRLLEGADGVLERVLFVPGTSFKVLEMTEPQTDGGRGRILLRELTSIEIDAEGRVDPNRISLDELALNSLRRQIEQWAESAPSVQLDPVSADRFGALPGLA
ncbi:hypothetical protein [Lentzea roselyniae]